MILFAISLDRRVRESGFDRERLRQEVARGLIMGSLNRAQDTGFEPSDPFASCPNESPMRERCASGGIEWQMHVLDEHVGRYTRALLQTTEGLENSTKRFLDAIESMRLEEAQLDARMPFYVLAWYWASSGVYVTLDILGITIPAFAQVGIRLFESYAFLRILFAIPRFLDRYGL